MRSRPGNAATGDVSVEVEDGDVAEPDPDSVMVIKKRFFVMSK